MTPQDPVLGRLLPAVTTFGDPMCGLVGTGAHFAFRRYWTAPVPGTTMQLPSRQRLPAKVAGTSGTTERISGTRWKAPRSRRARAAPDRPPEPLHGSRRCFSFPQPSSGRVLPFRWRPSRPIRARRARATAMVRRTATAMVRRTATATVRQTATARRTATMATTARETATAARASSTARTWTRAPTAIAAAATGASSRRPSSRRPTPRPTIRAAARTQTATATTSGLPPVRQPTTQRRPAACRPLSPCRPSPRPATTATPSSEPSRPARR